MPSNEPETNRDKATIWNFLEKVTGVLLGAYIIALSSYIWGLGVDFRAHVIRSNIALKPIEIDGKPIRDVVNNLVDNETHFRQRCHELGKELDEHVKLTREEVSTLGKAVVNVRHSCELLRNQYEWNNGD